MVAFSCRCAFGCPLRRSGCVPSPPSLAFSVKTTNKVTFPSILPLVSDSSWKYDGVSFYARNFLLSAPHFSCLNVCCGSTLSLFAWWVVDEWNRWLNVSVPVSCWPSCMPLEHSISPVGLLFIGSGAGFEYLQNSFATHCRTNCSLAYRQYGCACCVTFSWASRLRQGRGFM